MFCPVYKLGAEFSRRRIDEVKRDADRAGAINEEIAGITRLIRSKLMP